MRESFCLLLSLALVLPCGKWEVQAIESHLAGINIIRFEFLKSARIKALAKGALEIGKLNHGDWGILRADKRAALEIESYPPGGHTRHIKFALALQEFSNLP